MKWRSCPGKHLVTSRLSNSLQSKYHQPTPWNLMPTHTPCHLTICRIWLWHWLICNWNYAARSDNFVQIAYLRIYVESSMSGRNVKKNEFEVVNSTQGTKPSKSERHHMKVGWIQARMDQTIHIIRMYIHVCMYICRHLLCISHSASSAEFPCCHKW